MELDNLMVNTSRQVKKVMAFYSNFSYSTQRRRQ